jgi:DNA invertase Pin-like site-specific DNA recombinase
VWAQTEEGRAKLSAIAVDRHKNRPFNTKRIPEAKLRRLNELTAGGATVKVAAAKTGIGYSTAQRYLRKDPPSKLPVKAKDGYHRLEPKQIKRIIKGVRAGEHAEDTARAADCHVSSVYTYRRKMQNESNETAVVPVTVEPSSQGIPARDYQEFSHANDHTWKSVWDERREPTDGEVFFTMAWRRAKARAGR